MPQIDVFRQEQGVKTGGQYRGVWGNEYALEVQTGKDGEMMSAGEKSLTT